MDVLSDVFTDDVKVCSVDISSVSPLLSPVLGIKNSTPETIKVP